MFKRQQLGLFASLAFLTLLVACGSNNVPPGDLASSAPSAGNIAPAVSPAKATFAFERISGAPGNVADSLSEYIAKVAVKKNLKLVRRVGAPASYRVKGYLSAAGDQYNSTVFYVFDVVDVKGNRVHRIEGQEPSDGDSSDPWASISSDSLEQIATRSVTALQAWLHSR
ncbi:hypothetical protein [Flexibacterium corallicola]|uniref:hypothetical protein n=1 Tax=Flexibacterium corallicola TaxID=3037259 RepID=UPI00286F5067|nr:hypothetical protein [Pseudovibrio sp. M1P-2-3]